MAYPGGLIGALVLLLVALGIDLIAVILAFTRFKGGAVVASLVAVVVNTPWWMAAFKALGDGAHTGGSLPTEALLVMFVPCVLQVGIVVFCAVMFVVRILRPRPNGEEPRDE